MTREEKSNLLNELLKYEENNDIGNLTRAERREFQQWISKALEQESVLDEIRAEIDGTLSDGMIHKKTVLGIIDTYKEDANRDMDYGLINERDE